MTSKVRMLALAAVTGSALVGAPMAKAQSTAMTVGVSGWPASDGVAAGVDALLMEPQLGLGIRFLTQPSGVGTRAHAGMLMLAVAPTSMRRIVRFDMGFGFVAQSSRRALKAYQYVGVGYLAGVTAGAFRSHMIQPEVNAWAVLATSARFTGYSIGLRIRDPDPSN